MLILLSGGAPAATYFFSHAAGDNDFANAANWSGTPAGSDTLHINVSNPNHAVLSSGIAYIPQTVSLGNVSGQAGEMRTVSGGDLSVNSHFYVGNAGSGVLTMDGGALRTVLYDVKLGAAAGSSGIMTMSGGSVTAARHFNAGERGQGRLVMSGGEIRAGVFRVSYLAGSSGKVDLSGGVISAGDLIIGAGAVSNGMIHLSGSGRIILDGNKTSRIQGYIDAGRLRGLCRYDDVADRTLVVAIPEPAPPVLIDVGNFGAAADDGKCDVAAISAAVASAFGNYETLLVFGPGVYNLKEESATLLNGNLAMIHLSGLSRFSLRGAVAPDGNPATVLEMNLALGNDITGATHIDIRSGKQIRLENLTLDHNPRFATAGEIIAVDPAADRVEMEIFSGLPHFNGMKSYSANNWDLSTRLLIHGPALTIGTDQGSFQTWQKVDGYDRRYRITGAGFAGLVENGQGISFHFNLVAGDARTVDVYDTEDAEFVNIFIYSSIGMSVGAGDNRNMTFQKVHIRPEGASLAVGPRDGIHISRSTGRLWMDDVFVKGVRWDPIVSYMQFNAVTERVASDTIRISSSSVLSLLVPGARLVFWSGSRPHEAEIKSVDGGGALTFTEVLPDSVIAGSLYTPKAWVWDEAVIRNSTVEGNFGTALVFQSENLLVENCVFRNNAYSNIGLGPTSSGAGAFARNVTIRNNLFEQSSWVRKYEGTSAENLGTITLFENHPDFSTQAYNENILIEENIFRDIGPDPGSAGIHLKNAQDIIIRSNLYDNVPNTVIVDKGSSTNILNRGLGHNRVTNAGYAIESVPDYLSGLKRITVTRGPNEPVAGYSFSVDRDVTVYIAVHQRGDPLIPGTWEMMPEFIQWSTSAGDRYRDWVYKRSFPAGEVQIPPHYGFSGVHYGLPHMVFIQVNNGVQESLMIGNIPEELASLAEPFAGFHAVWRGDGLSPLSWAADAGFRDGNALRVYEGYLLNRKTLDEPFSIVASGLDPDRRLYARWHSDGPANGRVDMRATGDLTQGTGSWQPVPGFAVYSSGATVWRSESSFPGDVIFLKGIISPSP